MTSEDTRKSLGEDRGEAAAALKEVISGLLGRPLDDVQMDTELEAGLGLDSIHRVEIYNRMARQYGVHARSQELEAIETFGELIELVTSPDQGRPGKQPQ